ncbi:MAG: putative sugar nucleotidyl transferase, partial [Nitrososphaerota archaeon]
MRIAIFEDEVYQNFFPLTLTRPAYELVVGTSTIREKIVKSVANSGKAMFFCRKYLENVLRERLPNNYVNDFSTIDEDVLLINGLAIADESLNDVLRKLSRPGMVAMQKGRIVAAYVKCKSLEHSEIQAAITSADNITESILKIASEKLNADEVCLLKYPWELIELNPKLIAAELKGIGKKKWKDETVSSVTIYGSKKDVFIAKGAFLENGT